MEYHEVEGFPFFNGITHEIQELMHGKSRHRIQFQGEDT